MDSDKILGRKFGQSTTGKKDEQGYWHLDVVITEEVTYPDGTVKTESIESSAMDLDFNMAHQLALHSALSELRELVYDAGLDSLIEGKENQRKLEAENVSDSKADENTTTQ